MRRTMDNKNTRGWDSIRLQSIAFTEPTLRGGERSGNDQSSTMISSSLVVRTPQPCETPLCHSREMGLYRMLASRRSVLIVAIRTCAFSSG